MIDCPSCGEPTDPAANYCEACGADLSSLPTEPCVACGERDVSAEGYCMACGHKQPELRDHQEFVEGLIAAVSDRGRRHRHNEDAVAIGEVGDGSVVLVVCDGVSSTPGSAEASLLASAAARDLLVRELKADPDVDIATLLENATETAQEHASAAPELDEVGPYGTKGPPSSTFVAAVAQPRDGKTRVSVAWVGDSRAYWVSGDEAVRMTEDHEIGGSLIRWLGADSVEPFPDLSHLEAGEPGVLVVCSDGLWRYAESPLEMAHLVGRLRAGTEGMQQLAAGLVSYAIDCGGHDNVTAAVWASDGALPVVIAPPSDGAVTEQVPAVPPVGVAAPPPPASTGVAASSDAATDPVPAAVAVDPDPVEPDPFDEPGLLDEPGLVDEPGPVDGAGVVDGGGGGADDGPVPVAEQVDHGVGTALDGAGSADPTPPGDGGTDGSGLPIVGE